MGSSRVVEDNQGLFRVLARCVLSYLRKPHTVHGMIYSLMKVPRTSLVLLGKMGVFVCDVIDPKRGFRYVQCNRLNMVSKVRPVKYGI